MQWEYRIVSNIPDISLQGMSEQTEILNRLGSEEWELVGATMIDRRLVGASKFG